MDYNTKTLKLLKDNDLRITRHRKEVLNLIVSYESAIPFALIQKELSSMDRVTLYRTMNILLDNGIIHKIQVEDKETYYALCGHTCDDGSHEHNHVHFHCSSCDKVKCLEPDTPLNIGLNGFEIQNVDVQIKGVCDQCA